MSRSYKKPYTQPSHKYSPWHFQHSPKRHAVSSYLYCCQKNTVIDAKNYLENAYRDRTRHTSLKSPHYTSTFDDIYPASFRDKWAGRTKPSYCDKRTR
jgi:hypothetical protein